MGLIREPLQSRSRQVVEKLLEAAAHRFGQDGFERTSVRSIAADAGVPVGSVYQFFRDKEAVLETLTDRYVASVRGAFQAAKERSPDDNVDPIADGVGFIVDSLIVEAVKHPALRALLASADSSGPFALAGLRVRRQLAEEIAAKLTETEDEQRIVVGEVCAHIAQGLIARVVRSDGSLDVQLQAHMRRLIAVYILDIKANGIPR